MLHCWIISWKHFAKNPPTYSVYKQYFRIQSLKHKLESSPHGSSVHRNWTSNKIISPHFPKIRMTMHLVPSLQASYTSAAWPVLNSYKMIYHSKDHSVSNQGMEPDHAVFPHFNNGNWSVTRSLFPLLHHAWIQTFQPPQSNQSVCKLIWSPTHRLNWSIHSCQFKLDRWTRFLCKLWTWQKVLWTHLELDISSNLTFA